LSPTREAATLCLRFKAPGDIPASLMTLDPIRACGPSRSRRNGF